MVYAVPITSVLVNGEKYEFGTKINIDMLPDTFEIAFLVKNNGDQQFDLVAQYSINENFGNYIVFLKPMQPNNEEIFSFEVSKDSLDMNNNVITITAEAYDQLQLKTSFNVNIEIAKYVSQLIIDDRGFC